MALANKVEDVDGAVNVADGQVLLALVKRHRRHLVLVGLQGLMIISNF